MNNREKAMGITTIAAFLLLMGVVTSHQLKQKQQEDAEIFSDNKKTMLTTDLERNSVHHALPITGQVLKLTQDLKLR